MTSGLPVDALLESSHSPCLGLREAVGSQRPWCGQLRGGGEDRAGETQAAGRRETRKMEGHSSSCGADTRMRSVP